jgi:rhodanese-related sulfurtransferase
MSSITPEMFSDPTWLVANKFGALAEISWLLSEKENAGRDALIRVLENAELLGDCMPVVESLVQRAGLFPYQGDPNTLSTNELLNFEFHAVEGLDDIVLHSLQGQVYRALVDGANVILSAPTSFGKSLLMDAMIASRRFRNIVVIVPTIALIDETRRRLANRFSKEFKIITHPSQHAEEKNIYVLTQERFVEFQEMPIPEFFVLDEFYKLSPNRGDDRTFVLNEAFYKLFKSGAQFFLIGPNIQDITIDENVLKFRFFRTDFATVATEVRLITEGDETENAIKICQRVDDPTLIYCKSPKSAYTLAHALRNAGITAPTASASEFADWLRNNYHPEWVLADLLDAGIAVHHGALPRSVAYHLLRKFNDREVKFLLCTSTIIEGVNTSAKNVIIFDKRIGNQKPFDLFTFNNIKGRAGRMRKHFVGHVFVLNYEPQPELPLVDFPAFTQPDDAPESLLIQIEQKDLSEHSIEKLRYLYGQDILPMEVMRSNSGMEPAHQLNLATELASNVAKYHPELGWSGFPSMTQLHTVCSLIFVYLMGGKGRDGIGNANHLYMKMKTLVQKKTVSALAEAELAYQKDASPSEALETVLKFVRQWGEFQFPRYLAALDNIQRSVFEKAGRKPGDYSVFGASVKRLFMPLAATVLEEYGLPFQVTLRIEKANPLGDEVDEILDNLGKVDVSALGLDPIEVEMAKDTISNL